MNSVKLSKLNQLSQLSQLKSTPPSVNKHLGLFLVGLIQPLEKLAPACTRSAINSMNSVKLSQLNQFSQLSQLSQLQCVLLHWRAYGLGANV